MTKAGSTLRKLTSLKRRNVETFFSVIGIRGIIKGHLDRHCNISHCKIDQVLSCSDSYILELPLNACLKPLICQKCT